MSGDSHLPEHRDVPCSGLTCWACGAARTCTRCGAPPPLRVAIPGGEVVCRDGCCTCVGGSWCVQHGTCTCPPYEERELGPLTHVIGNIWVKPRLHVADCPLHGRVLTPCDACTGDGGRGHTLRGECMGAPCEDCGQARYVHLPGECPSTKVRPRDA